MQAVEEAASRGVSGAGGAGRLFPMAGSLRTDGLDLSRLAGVAGRPPILRPVELTACDGSV